MKKQRRRIYAALLCSSMVLSLVSTPVSAAETGQLMNPPTSTEGPGSPESARTVRVCVDRKPCGRGDDSEASD